MASSSVVTASLTYLRPEVADLKAKIDRFVEEECIPAEAEYHAHMHSRSGANRWTLDAIPPCVRRLQERSKALGLWNLFIPPHLVKCVPDPSLKPTISLSYREYGMMCESLGRCPEIAPQACNTSAPDTGNMEVLLEFGTPQQKERYLLPLLRGDIRSAFLMTEPAVASSDPTNLATTLTKCVRNDGEVEYHLNGTKWWSTGAMDPRCKVALVVAKMDYSQCISTSAGKNNGNKHGAHTIVAVPMPQPGVRLDKALTVFGYDDAPHGHAQVTLTNVRLTPADLIHGEGSGFAVSQARLGPGRIHHCMRAIGIATRSFDLMLQRSVERKTFGKCLWEHGGCQELIADSVADLDAARLVTLDCASKMDQAIYNGAHGFRNMRDAIASIKVAVPAYAYRVVDRAVQVYGGSGVNHEFLARSLVGLRTLRIADGPDAVHRRTVAQQQIRKRFPVTKLLSKRQRGNSRL